MRTRGLKPILRVVAARLDASRSYADARIETSIVMSTSATSCIAFLCGRAD
ncbi:hypothetical protein HMPREF7545_1561 [Selenomonas noxia ATCC 43541]|nr:hypothetical protein HMPREF7545_1561 [Selenomonas noxia ATCC 43541]